MAYVAKGSWLTQSPWLHVHCTLICQGMGKKKSRKGRGTGEDNEKKEKKKKTRKEKGKGKADARIAGQGSNFVGPVVRWKYI